MTILTILISPIIYHLIKAMFGDICKLEVCGKKIHISGFNFADDKNLKQITDRHQENKVNKEHIKAYTIL